MTEKETWKNIQDILMRVYCSDDEEHKKVVLAVNEGISEEAWQLYRDAIVIDGCAGWLHRANWITDEGGTDCDRIDYSNRLRQWGGLCDMGNHQFTRSRPSFVG